jgi:hypothetical protein
MFGRPAAPATPETPASELPDNDPIDDPSEDDFRN